MIASAISGVAVRRLYSISCSLITVTTSLYHESIINITPMSIMLNVTFTPSKRRHIFNRVTCLIKALIEPMFHEQWNRTLMGLSKSEEVTLLPKVHILCTVENILRLSKGDHIGG